MAGKRFEIAHSPYDSIPTMKVQTDAAATIIEKGMLIKFTSNGSPYGTPCVDGDHTLETDTAIYGLAAKDSTHTSIADGYVEVYIPLPGIIYRGYATTAANIDTEAKLNLLLGDRVGIDVSATTSAGDWTIDENEGEAQALSFQMVAGNYEKGTLDFIIRAGATFISDQDIA